jgi:hypothetical protein
VSKLTALVDGELIESKSCLFKATKSVSDSDAEEELDMNVFRLAAIVAFICSATLVVVSSRWNR